MMSFFTAFRGYSVALCLVTLILCTGLFSALPAWRLDLTDDDLYTLGDGSKQLLSELSVPITLNLYFSRSLAGDLPQLKDYAQRIEDLLFEYQALNPKNFIVNVIDPEPFSEAEDKATAAGLQGAPVTLGGESLYLGLIATGDGGEQKIISFFNPERERFLEYDISQIVHRLGQPSAIKLKVLSGVQMFGGYDFASQRSTAPWAVVEQLGTVAEVQEIHPPQTVIDADVLMIVHPQNLDDMTLYAIDQYLLGGGKAMIFVDPHAEINARAPGQADSSNLPKLFEAWGLVYDESEIVGDSQWGMRISTARQGPVLPHVGIIGLPLESMNDDSVMTAELESINVASSGHLLLREGSELSVEPLMVSSTESMLMGSERYAGMQDHGVLLTDFEATPLSYTLAVQIAGRVNSAFESAPKVALDEAQDGESLALDGEAQYNGVAESSSVELADHRSSGDIQLIVVADVDLLSDRLWVQVSNFFGQQVVVPWANNGDLVMNAVENLGGSQLLIALRSRGQYARPFEVVNQLRTTAAEEFKQQEQVLLQRLEELETRIASLTPAADGQGQPMLSEAQEVEIEAFEAQRLETRKQLRQVQHHLNQSIDALESKLRWLNMGLMPMLLLVVMMIVLFYRRRTSGL